MRYSIWLSVMLLVSCSALRPDHQSPVIAYTTRQIEDNPNDPKPLFARGHAFSKHGDYAQAVADFDAAISLDPHQGKYYLARARANFYALNDRGNWAGTVAALSPADPLRILGDLEQAITLDPNASDGSAYFLRGGIRLLQFRDEEAAADFSEYIRRNPAMKKEVETASALWRKKRDAAPKEHVAPLRPKS